MGDQPYPDPFGSQMIQRCVIVQRDERGYGLTVSGDNPVFVQSVKDNGAAQRAGVQEGDRIIKVNGTLVTQSNHLEVVKMIRSGPYVALTLLGKPPGSNGPPLPSPHTGTSPVNPTNPTSNIQTPGRPNITNPQPADPEQGAALRNERLNTYRNMLEQEKQLYDKQRTEYNVHPTEKLQKELNGIQTRIRVLEQQLQKAYREGAYPKAVIPTIISNAPDNSDLLMDEQIAADPNRRKSDSRVPRLTPHHARQRSTPETLGFIDDNMTAPSAGLKRNNSDVQVKDSVRQKLKRGGDSRRTDRRPPDLGASGRVREQIFSKSVGSAPDGSQQDSDMGDSPASTPPSQRRTKVPEGMEGLEDFMNPGSSSTTFQVASVGTIEPLNQPQIGIISMEDDEFASDTENFDDHGPFNRFEELEKKHAHMAVFLHYLISNSDPSSLFFYLVTDSYKNGSLKEMKKWVYEIFSSFLAPAAPLRIQVPDVYVTAIENTTNNQRDNEDAMRNVFNAARGAAHEEIKELLADFRNKRALGLGSIFGDQQLQAEDMDRSSELKIVEQTLLPHLERLTALEAEKEGKNVAMAAALTTFLKNVGVRVQGNAALERCPSFTAREKRNILPSRQRPTKKHVKGHLFQECHFYNTALCYHCDGLLWGIGNQGYQCQYCDLTIHKIGNCLDKLEDTCQGSGSKNKNKRMPFKNKDKKRPERTSSTLTGPDRPKDEVLSPTSPQAPGSHIVGPHRPQEDDDELKQLKGSKTVEAMSQMFEEGEDSYKVNDSGISGGESFDSADVIEGEGGRKIFKSKRNNLGRSESLKGHGEKIRRSRSDRRTRSDVDKDQQNVQDALDKSNTSSSSSLSGSQDSPSASVDSLASRPIEEEYPLEDSDMEAETDTPNWQDLVDKDMVKRLKPKEVKRQEIINEFFHTEKTHVRILKVLNRVFYQPMLRNEVIPKEMIQLLFPNLKELLEIHMALNNAMKKERRTSHIIQEIGDMLLKRFDGEGGEQMKQVCATFCQNQKAALDMVKAREKKDSRLEKFISDAESNPLCQRLPLRGLISTGFQRLTKYPLLIENLLKYSQSKTEEFKKLQKVSECSKALLDHVNTAIRECENQQILLEISKKIDKGPLERSNNEIVKEFKNLDLTSRKLIHHSPLTWRLSKKTIDLYTLLLEDILVLLQKTDDKDKYILKCHSTTVATLSESQKNTHSPIILLNSVLCRPVATNKYAFFLVSTSVAGPQIYELVTSNKKERETWMELILKAQEISKKRPSWRNDRRGGRVVVPKAIIQEDDEEKPETPSPGADAKAPSTPIRPSEIDRQISKTDASKQKPEEIESLLADSIRAKLPEDIGTEDLLNFLVTMSARITPLLKDVHEKRSCTKTEENILKAVEIMESKLAVVQSLVVHNEQERHELQERCRALQVSNDELQDEKERLQQEFSASQHELLCLNESMQQIRGDQPMASADATSYESLPTTDIDRTPDEESAAKANNRLSYSGESGSTTDSEGGELDEGASAGATAPSIEGGIQAELPVRIVANVVTELQPTEAHTAIELANDQLASLHRAAANELDKLHRGRSQSPERNEAISHKSTTAEDDEYTPLGAPPPIPVEPDEDGGKTPSVGEYRDSDMDEALDTIEEPPTDHVETTQEIVQENAPSPQQQTDDKQQQLPTVHSQMEQSESNSRHSPAIPLEDRGEGNGGASSDASSALRNNTVTTEDVSLEMDKACHIEVIDSDKQLSIESPSSQPTRSPELEQTSPDQASLQSPTSDMQITNSPTSSADKTTTSGHSEHEPNGSDITQLQDSDKPEPQDNNFQPQDDPLSQDDMIKFEDDLQLKEDFLELKKPQDDDKPTIASETELRQMEIDPQNNETNGEDKQDEQTNCGEVDVSPEGTNEGQAAVDNESKPAESVQEITSQSETETQIDNTSQTEYAQSEKVEAQTKTIESSDAEKVETVKEATPLSEGVQEKDENAEETQHAQENNPKTEVTQLEGDLQPHPDSNGQKQEDIQAEPEPELV